MSAVTRNILRRGIKRLRKGWTTQAYARNSDGLSVGPNDPCAVSWCAVGAINQKLVDRDGYNEAIGLLAETVGIVPMFNDSQTSVDPVIEAFKKAIKLDRERETQQQK